ncbi:Xaa-Pro aminopeptidase [Candidatus Poribacteria bacterium]|nr:Xaa-Pro aminopeptidase [Candidatus Poribacteria bacterium]
MDGQTGLLLVSASESNANMFYATRFGSSSTFIYLETAEERVIVIGNLEIERARQGAQADRVLPLVQYWKMAQEKHQKAPGTEEVVDVLMRDLGLSRVIVPPDFSLKFADGIRSYGHAVEVKLEPFFERRLLKDETEVAAVRETVRHTEAAISGAIDAIRRANISATGILELDGEQLTSERVRRDMHQYLIERDCVASHTIVSCGSDTSMPHEEGHGPLHANQPIIIDCNPRSASNGYYCDITRTVVRGTAPTALQRQYEAVLEAQEFAYGMLKPGANGREIHASVTEFLDGRGYKTHQVDGKPQGFFHATGHGFGIEAHERPHFALKEEYAQAGNIVAVEPALYYSDTGGVRIEDDYLITDGNAEQLTTLDKNLEI